MAPLQNRVLPTGEIVSHPARGLLMGNRGCIHRADGTLGTSRWRSPMWICCVLDWKGVRREVMPPGRWTALFFLDEATALAAGHRPCGYCRRSDFLQFADLWGRAVALGKRPRAGEIDRVLHAERLVPGTRRQATRAAAVGRLPDGAMVRHDGAVCLVVAGALRPWTFDGYGSARGLPGSAVVELLTPPTIVGVLARGYRPLVHPSAASGRFRSLSA